MATTLPVATDEMKNDTRGVCVFCSTEKSYDSYSYCCGEYGSVLSRAEYFEYTGEDFFADE